MNKEKKNKWTCPCGKEAQTFDLCSEECKQKYTYSAQEENMTKESREKRFDNKFSSLNAVKCEPDGRPITKDLKSHLESEVERAVKERDEELKIAYKKGGCVKLLDLLKGDDKG